MSMLFYHETDYEPILTADSSQGKPARVLTLLGLLEKGLRQEDDPLEVAVTSSKEFAVNFLCHLSSENS